MGVISIVMINGDTKPTPQIHIAGKPMFLIVTLYLIVSCTLLHKLHALRCPLYTQGFVLSEIQQIPSSSSLSKFVRLLPAMQLLVFPTCLWILRP